MTHFLFRVMKASNHSPDLLLVNTFMSIYAHAGRGTDAIGLLEYIRKRPTVKKCIPDNITYTAAMTACYKGGLFKEVGYLFQGMQRHWKIIPDAVCCRLALKAYHGENKYVEMRHVALMMRQKKNLRDNDWLIYLRMIQSTKEDWSKLQARMIALEVMYIGSLCV